MNFGFNLHSLPNLLIPQYILIQYISQTSKIDHKTQKAKPWTAREKGKLIIINAVVLSEYVVVLSEYFFLCNWCNDILKTLC